MESVVSDSFDVTTLLGSGLGLQALLPVDFELKHEFTLNNHLDIFPNQQVNVLPKLRYFGVGIKGCYNADDGILSAAYNPSRTNMNLYSLIPLRCRPVDEDLNDIERAQYRLRVRKTLDDGNEYILYYLKVLTFNEEVGYKRIDTATGKEESYTPNSANLAPIPQAPSTDTVVTTDTTQIVAYCKANVKVEADEVLEYINANFGDPRYAKISELGFFTGVDFTATGTTGVDNTPVTYKEAAYVMLYNHLTNLGYPLTSSGMSIDATFDITSRGDIVGDSAL